MAFALCFCPNTHSKSLKVSLFAQLFGNPWNFATVDRRQFVISCKKSVFWVICNFFFGVGACVQTAGQQFIGFVFGEWKGVKGKPVKIIVIGLILLFIGIIILSFK